LRRLVSFAARIPREVRDWIFSEAVTSGLTPSAMGCKILERAYAELKGNRKGRVPATERDLHLREGEDHHVK
jgi:hypothetical protein